MKYFIQYPGYIVCNLRCPYCFHYKELSTGLSSGGDIVGQGGPNFSIEEYIAWRDTHLTDAEELLVHFHGGEPTMDINLDLIDDFCAKTTFERIDILTNGLGPIDSYARLIAIKDRIYRIGLTYHRKVIHSNPTFKKIFTNTALLLKQAGIPIYVKEMLFLDSKTEILAHKKFWESLEVPFKIQDFKGYTRGEDFTEMQQYTANDIAIIDEEYIKTSNICSCLPGYRQILIRGGWMAGDILGCWIDPVIIGNIKDNTYNPCYKVEIELSLGKQTVTGVPKIYKGTYAHDRYYDNLNK